MESLDRFTVDLKGMTEDTVSYRWKADKDFFSAVQGPEIRQGLLDVALRVKRTSDAYELMFQLKGTVEVPCDRCLEPMDQSIDAQCSLRVVLGGAYADDGEVVTIPERDGTINVAWHIYEFAALEIPLRHVHAEGACPAGSVGASAASTPEVNGSQPSGEDMEPEAPDCDPRWEELKKILHKQ